MRKIVHTLVLAVLLASIVALPFYIEPVGASGTIYIRADGSVEGTTNISTADNVTYTLNGTVNDSIVIERSNITIDGAGYTVNGSGTGVGFTLTNINNVTIKNLTIKGFHIGIQLSGSLSNTISGNNVTTNNDDGIQLHESSNYNTISGNNVTTNNGDGVQLYRFSNYNTISGNNVTTNNRDGIYLHESLSNTISGNNIATNSYDGIYLYRFSNYNTISGNNVTTNNWTGIELDYSSSNSISGNNITANNDYGIELDHSSNNNSISGNILTDGRCGIRVQNARYTEIYNNTIAHNYGGDWDAGIRLDAAGYSRISSNLITDNWRGILLYTSSPYVSICNNTLTDNEFAIRVASGGSNYLNVSDNVVMNNRGYGIGLTGFGGTSNYATILGNLIVNNSDGIALGQYSNHNTILQNNISQNDYGFYVDYSTQNTMWGNNIVDNDQQVYVSTGSINNWDGGYPSGGNYWSDYVGSDLYGGPFQNEARSDGIGDTQYIIDANDIDHYPLMKPYAGPHDIGAKVHISRTVVPEGYRTATNITVTIINYGVQTENVNVTCQTTTTTYESFMVTSRNSTTMVFTWNTTGLSKGNYTILVSAEPVQGEMDTADNYCTHWVVVAMLGDITGPNGWPDGKCDMRDVGLVAGKFGKSHSNPGYDANCDITGPTTGVPDGKINMRDVGLVARHFGETDP